MTIKLIAKLNAVRRGPRGFFVTLEVNSLDSAWQEVGAAELGTTFGVVMVEVSPESAEASPGADNGPGDSLNTGQQNGEVGKPRTPWVKLQRSARAAIRCEDPKFQLWLSKRYPKATCDAAELVRQFCGVKSRADLNEDREAAEKFDRLDTQFMMDTGQLAEVRA